MRMKKFSFVPLLLLATFGFANIPISEYPDSPPPAPNFTVTTSDGQVKNLYSDYINQQKLVVIEAFFTTCPPCATHAPLFQNLYTSMQNAYPGQVEFILLSTLFTDTNVKVAQYKTSKGLTMPGVGNDGGSIAALQPYTMGQYGSFQGTPTFIVIAPGTGAVTFDVRGNSPSQTMIMLQQSIEFLLIKPCKLDDPFGNALEDVTLHASNALYDTSFLAQGTYDLSDNPLFVNNSYTIRPDKGGNPHDGLTTYDLVLISKHILAVEPFECPWQIIAADLNCTGSITTFDIVQARKLILGIVDTLPCGNWRFMPDSAQLGGGFCQDFVGVKLGDVNAGPCNDSLASPADSRGQPLAFYFKDQLIRAGESARVSLFSVGELSINGLQFALDIAPNQANINNLESTTLESFGGDNYELGESSVSLSWSNAYGQTLQPNSPILTFDITSQRQGRLSEIILLSTTRLIPEMYDTGGKIHPLIIHSTAAAAHFALWPNPAQNRFFVSVEDVQEGDCLLQVLDIQGKIILEKTVFASPGLNNWELEIPAHCSGLYFVKVGGQAAGKLVVRK